MKDIIGRLLQDFWDELWENYGVCGIIIFSGIIFTLIGITGLKIPPYIDIPPLSIPLIFFGVILILVGAFLLVKSYPKEAQVHQNFHNINSKLTNLHELNKEQLPFVLVGSVYLDVILGPINTIKLEKDEWSNIDSINFGPGGSCLWVGRYLWKFCNEQKSYVFSKLGKSNDFLTNEFQKLIKHEQDTWLQNKMITSVTGSGTAMTVHLVQNNKRFTTMFTYQGVLARLDWTDFQPELNELLTSGGVLYISGYFKTNLCAGLVANLKEFKEHTLICIDHGRFVQDLVNRNALQVLDNAFNEQLIDVYFCTYKELVDFCQALHDVKYPAKPKNIKRTLQKIAKCTTLPPITIVRDDDLEGITVAYAIIGKSLVLTLGERTSTPDDKIGSRSAFNAGMMYYLINGIHPQNHEFEVLVEEAGKKAFKLWFDAATTNWNDELNRTAYSSDLVNKKLMKGSLYDTSK